MTARRRDRIAISSALAGSVAILVGSVVGALAYAGREGEPYSPLNHWVSELGEPGVSALGPVFNLSLVVGGLCFAVFMAGLAASGNGPLRFAYGAVGVAAGLAGTLVGVFPMTQSELHGTVAMTFFNLGWIAVGLASIGAARGTDERLTRPVAAIGGLTVAAFLAFLVEIRVDPLIGQVVLGVPVERPGAWAAPLLEWAVIAGIVCWTFVAALAWRARLRAATPAAVATAPA